MDPGSWVLVLPHFSFGMFVRRGLGRGYIGIVGINGDRRTEGDLWLWLSCDGLMGGCSSMWGCSIRECFLVRGVGEGEVMSEVCKRLLLTGRGRGVR